MPCTAHPGTHLVHLDGPCRCFFGGPAPEYDNVLQHLNFAGHVLSATRS